MHSSLWLATKAKLWQTPSVTNYFKPVLPSAEPRPSTTGTSRKSVPGADPGLSPCQHLRGEPYTEYIFRTHTRSLGGVSPIWRARVARRLFPYKKLPRLQTDKLGRWLGNADSAVEAAAEATTALDVDIPSDGNGNHPEGEWTSAEHRKIDHALGGWARWQVDFGGQYVKSTQCQGVTKNKSGVCNMCEELGEKDLGLRRSIARVSQSTSLQNGVTCS